MTGTFNKKKIINDPIYGFIEIKHDIIYDLISHPYYQRLRRIKQLGLTNYVYPGATHTRFQHAVGATHLMGLAIDTLRNKGIEISESEAEAVTCAILLHDIGHGPFSHALENKIVESYKHESISSLLIEDLNKQMNGRLGMTMEIFDNQYPKYFLNQLVSSQLDMDRLDYLKRDSFFSGVSEGVIGEDRIIKMLDVRENKLVSDIKGIYSIERFLTARRLMYWQVYLHKTAISAEILLSEVWDRAKWLAKNGHKLFTTPALKYFLFTSAQSMDDKEMLYWFTKLDDNDILTAAKVWMDDADKVLSLLCKKLIDRNLNRVELQDYEFETDRVHNIAAKVIDKYKLTEEEVKYLVGTSTVSNHAYEKVDQNIRIIKKGKIEDISEVSDIINVEGLINRTRKHCLYYPKDCMD